MQLQSSTLDTIMQARNFSTMSQLGFILLVVVLLNASPSASFVAPLSNNLQRRERQQQQQQQQRFSLLLSSKKEIDSNSEDIYAPRPGSMSELYEETGKVPYGEDSRQYRRT